MILLLEQHVLFLEQVDHGGLLRIQVRLLDDNGGDDRGDHTDRNRKDDITRLHQYFTILQIII